MSSFVEKSRASQAPRQWLVVARVTLGVIFIDTMFQNLSKGFYTAEGLRGFLLYLADGHPIGPYAAFLTQVVAPITAVFAPFQLVAEIGIGLALIFGAFTPLAGLGALVFSFNLFLTYLNPNLGEWIWTYVMLMALAFTSAFGLAGRSFGIDLLFLQKRGEPKYPIY